MDDRRRTITTTTSRNEERSKNSPAAAAAAAASAEESSPPITIRNNEDNRSSLVQLLAVTTYNNNNNNNNNNRRRLVSNAQQTRIWKKNFRQLVRPSVFASRSRLTSVLRVVVFRHSSSAMMDDTDESWRGAREEKSRLTTTLGSLVPSETRWRKTRVFCGTKHARAEKKSACCCIPEAASFLSRDGDY